MSQEHTPSHGVDRVLQKLCDASATIGGLVLVAIASVTVVSVIGRAFFSHPILGDVELVQLGCAVVVASFLPYTQFRHANIIVDFFTTNASEATQSKLDAFGTLLYTLVMALVALVWQMSLLNNASADAYFTLTLQTWERGQFIRFHGLIQWMGWLWPYATLIHLVRRLSSAKSMVMG